MRAIWIVAVAAGLAVGGSAFAQDAFDVEEAAAVCAPATARTACRSSPTSR